MSATRFLNSEKGKRFVLLCLGALLVIGGVAWFYDYHQWTLHQEYQGKTAELNAQIKEANRLAMTVAQTAAVRVQMQQFVEAHEATMVSGDHFVWAIRVLSELAESQPVANVVIQPGSDLPHARKPTRQWYVTHIECQGDYDQIGAFIQALENQFPEAEIRSLTIGETLAPAIHRAVLDFALLVQPAVVPSSAPATPKAGPAS